MAQGRPKEKGPAPFGVEPLLEVRRMRFEERYEPRLRRTLTMAETEEMLGVTERTFRRWSGHHDTEGV